MTHGLMVIAFELLSAAPALIRTVRPLELLSQAKRHNKLLFGPSIARLVWSQMTCNT